jgi:hypothetical protein
MYRVLMPLLANALLWARCSCVGAVPAYSVLSDTMAWDRVLILKLHSRKHRACVRLVGCGEEGAHC